MNANQQVNSFRPVTVAAPGTPCGWTHRDSETGQTSKCAADRPAIHVLTMTLPVAQVGTALCGYHSPFDATAAERAATTVADTYCLDGKCGTCTDCVECAQVTESSLDCFQEAMAEAERDEAQAEGPSGIDVLRELLTLEPIPTAKRPKVIHAGDLGPAKTAACGRMVDVAQMTSEPDKTTCKRCLGTQRFQRWATRVAWQVKRDEFERAGLRSEMVIREISGAGRFGVVARIDSGGIEIYFWTPDQAGKTYRQFATVARFDEACEIVILDKVIKVGDRLVSNLGGEAVVLGVTSTSVRYRRMGIGTPVDLTASEFAAELARGFVAVIPTLRVRVSQVIRWNARPHQYGIVTALNSVNPSQATMSVHSLGSDQYGVTLHLDKLAQEIMRGDATISELPVGSWR